jgi:hypothetical protein
MALVKNVEKRIFDIEDFEVRIRDANGRALKRNGQLRMYKNYERQAQNNWKVSEWKEQRFDRRYPRLEVDVLDGQGNVARGNTTLGRVRDTYSEE